MCPESTILLGRGTNPPVDPDPDASDGKKEKAHVVKEPVDDSAKFTLPVAAVAEALPIAGPSFARPDPALIRQLHAVSSATASALMHRMGVRQTFVRGLTPRQPGAKVVGP